LWDRGYALILTVENFPGKHFLGGDDLGVPRKFTCNTVSGGVTKPAGDELRDIHRIPPTQGCQGGAYACAPRFGDVHEKKVVFDGKQHLLLPYSG